MGLRFTVTRGSWLPEGQDAPFVDEVEIEDPSVDLIRLAAHAHDAGVIEVTEGLDESHLQSQEDGEAAHEDAKGTWVERTWNDDGTATPGYWDGPWGVGNQAQHELEQAQRRLASARDGGDPDLIVAAEENLAAVDATIQERFAA